MRRECECPRAKHEHGTRAAYSRCRCRCLPCCMANHWALKSYKAGEGWVEYPDRYVPRAGMRLRLQALAAIGHSARYIAERIGLTESYVCNLRTDKRGVVHVDTFRAVAAVYDELWDKPNLTVDGRRNASRARRMGYRKPLELDEDEIDAPGYTGNEKPAPTLTDPFVDEVAVQEAIAGRRVALTDAELSAAIDRLTDLGLSTRQIADRLGTYERRVQRNRSRRRESAA